MEVVPSDHMTVMVAGAVAVVMPVITNCHWVGLHAWLVRLPALTLTVSLWSLTPLDGVIAAALPENSTSAVARTSPSIETDVVLDIGPHFFA